MFVKQQHGILAGLFIRTFIDSSGNKIDLGLGCHYRLEFQALNALVAIVHNWLISSRSSYRANSSINKSQTRKVHSTCLFLNIYL